MKKKYVRARHKFYFSALRPVAWILARRYRFKTKPQKLEKGQNYLILSNHQTVLDPVFLCLTIKHPIYFVASDALYSQKWYLRLLFHCFAPIKKRKGFADAACIRTMVTAAREGGTVAVFPEGNRQWNDSQMYIDRSVVKLVRLLGLPVVLYNFHGGYGVQPRWGKALRRGSFTGAIREILSVEAFSAMTDDALYEKIVSELKVIDPEQGGRYTSSARAEYLERELFVCPKCRARSTLFSRGNEIACRACGYTAVYGEDMHLSAADGEPCFSRLVDWYGFQLDYVRGLKIGEEEVLCEDDGVTLYDKTEREQKVVAAGTMRLTKDALSVDGYVIPTSSISGGGAQGGIQLIFNADGRSYLAVGSARFNSVKYLLLFDRVCKQIADKGGDKYYGLALDPRRL